MNSFSITGIMNTRPQTVAGLMANNPYPRLMNGSIWTLGYEFACYICLTALVAVNALRRARWVVLGLFLALFGIHAFSCVAPQVFWQSFPYRMFGELVRLSLFFSLGCVAFLYRAHIPSTGFLFTAAVFVTGLAWTVAPFSLLAPLGMAYAILWLAVSLPFTGFDAKGDYSYGIYIYAFPVQQVMAFLHVHESGFVSYLVASLLGTALLAFLSYRLIEAPCLRLKGFDPLASFNRGAWRARDLPLSVVRPLDV